MDLAALLGTREDDPTVAARCDTLGEVEVEESANYRCLDYLSAGVALVFQSPLGTKPATHGEETVLTAIHLFARDVEGHLEYRGLLPNNLQFGDPLDAAVSKTPPGADAGGGHHEPLLGKTRKWLRYRAAGGFRLRLEFDVDDETLVLATLDAVDSEC